ncbi:hypothetical protein [Roseibium sp. RKSG952]|uniref:hypothetical protein n=1 Tax=Roseibium sp. RKSG952 TaxID=2529384 RepID=UPI0012BB79D4|nr:hypothetical protein [Roseibium sp. RKSG952]MTI00485.1 hypothetical protein [Roseibium sp. RKSG952]
MSGQMSTGLNGRIAVSWNQTELDGLEAAPLALVAVGSAWSWRGKAVQLSAAETMGLVQTAHSVAPLLTSGIDMLSAIGPVIGSVATIEFSNGSQQFSAELIRVEGSDSPVLIFENGCPERDQEFWVRSVSAQTDLADFDREVDQTVVAFPGPRSEEKRESTSTPHVVYAAE